MISSRTSGFVVAGVLLLAAVSSLALVAGCHATAAPAASHASAAPSAAAAPVATEDVAHVRPFDEGFGVVAPAEEDASQN